MKPITVGVWHRSLDSGWSGRYAITVAIRERITSEYGIL